jgi:hypothetical protein
MRAGCRLSFLAVVLGLAPLGCRHNNDLLENELRERDKQFREALDELGKAEHHTLAQQREIEALRHGASITPEQAAQTFGLKRITFGRGTGGLDNDSLPGDEALQVVVEPRDGDDHVVKVPASLHITAIEIDTQGLKRPLCWWALTPEQLRPNWKQGLLSTGYAVVLPWTVFPQHDTVRVVVQLKLADGRCFEADKDIKVRLLPIAPRPLEAAPDVLPPSPGAGSFIIPSAGVQAAPANELRWSPAPESGGVHIGRPQPLSGLSAIPEPTLPSDPLPLPQ